MRLLEVKFYSITMMMMVGWQLMENQKTTRMTRMKSYLPWRLWKSARRIQSTQSHLTMEVKKTTRFQTGRICRSRLVENDPATLQTTYFVDHEPDDDNILRTWTYDVSITYDKYY